MANRIDQYTLYQAFVFAASQHYVEIAKHDSTQIGFVRGWVNRARRAPYSDESFTIPIV
jgi:hypothetical protein